MSRPPKGWYTWPTKTMFDQWHSVVIEGLGLPRVGHNAATGELEPDAAWTTRYTLVVKVAKNDWRAPVETTIANLFSDGLGEPSTPPPQPEEF